MLSSILASRSLFVDSVPYLLPNFSVKIGHSKILLDLILTFEMVTLFIIVCSLLCTTSEHIGYCHKDLHKT